jgi:transcriptional regulator with XRE-family HTH domain
MKSAKEKEPFIQLRAEGLSLRKIEAILGISRKTLSSWEPKLDEEIAKEQGRQLEHFNETYWATKKRRLGFLNERLNLLHEEESKRDLSDIPTAKLIQLELQTS